VQALLAAYPEAAKARDKVRRPSPLAAWMRGPEQSSEVIICNQGQSGVITRNHRALRGTQRAIRGLSVALSGPQRALRGPQRYSEVMISNRRSSEASQRAVRGNQGQSVVIMSNQGAISSTQSHAEATQRSSEVIGGTQRHSEALKGTQRHSDALGRNQRQSEALRRNQRHSAALRGHSAALSGHRDPRRTRGPRLPAPSLVARRRRARPFAAPSSCAPPRPFRR
jgi:hypothetical protein